MLAQPVATRPIVLRLSTAAELMTRNPLSFDKNTPIHKASALLDFHNLEAAPVVDECARPQGVVSRTACAGWQEFCLRSSPHGHISVDFDLTTITEIANPTAATMHKRNSSREVIDRLVQQQLRRIYVVNDDGALIGVVSRADVLRHMLAGDIRRRITGADAWMLC